MPNTLRETPNDIPSPLAISIYDSTVIPEPSSAVTERLANRVPNKMVGKHVLDRTCQPVQEQSRASRIVLGVKSF